MGYRIALPGQEVALEVDTCNVMSVNIPKFTYKFRNKKLELYAVYMETRGKKLYLFADNIYAHPREYIAAGRHALYDGLFVRRLR